MKIVIEIDGKFGSDFRNECGPETLELMLNAWKQFEESRHKKTKLEIKFEKK